VPLPSPVHLNPIRPILPDPSLARTPGRSARPAPVNLPTLVRDRGRVDLRQLVRPAPATRTDRGPETLARWRVIGGGSFGARRAARPHHGREPRGDGRRPVRCAPRPPVPTAVSRRWRGAGRLVRLARSERAGGRLTERAQNGRGAGGAGGGPSPRRVGQAHDVSGGSDAPSGGDNAL